MRLAVVHFQPLELYPPVLNLISYLEKKNYSFQVFSTENIVKGRFSSPSSSSIKRFRSFVNFGSGIVRSIGYLYFNLGVFFRLIFYNPTHLLYFESYSALPVFWYLRLFGKNKKLWIHQHEYFDREWYEKGMKTVRHYHRKEIRFLYPFARGISHTNAFRLDLFLADHPFLNRDKLHVMPNFPPQDWYSRQRKIETMSIPLRTVTVGSVSLRASYLKEYCEWIISQKGKVLFDIYSVNMDTDTLTFLRSLESPYIHFCEEGIAYSEIPEMFHSKSYEAGLILYRGLYANTVWSASNKMFEYLACGMDVWLPEEIKGSVPYLTKGSYPKVCRLNFNDLSHLDLNEITSRKDCVFKPVHFTCEEVYDDLLKKFLSPENN